MNNSIRFTLFILLIAALLVTMCQKKPEMVKNVGENPLIGTWKFVKTTDQDGNDRDAFQGMVAYATFLKNGTYYFFAVKAGYPNTGKMPETLEEYQKIGQSVMGSIYTYTCDALQQKASFHEIHSVNPANVGNTFTANYKIKNGKLTWWFSGKAFYEYVRVK